MGLPACVVASLHMAWFVFSRRVDSHSIDVASPPRSVPPLPPHPTPPVPPLPSPPLPSPLQARLARLPRAARLSRALRRAVRSLGSSCGPLQLRSGQFSRSALCIRLTRLRFVPSLPFAVIAPATGASLSAAPSGVSKGTRTMEGSWARASRGASFHSCALSQLQLIAPRPLFLPPLPSAGAALAAPLGAGAAAPSAGSALRGGSSCGGCDWGSFCALHCPPHSSHTALCCLPHCASILPSIAVLAAPAAGALPTGTGADGGGAPGASDILCCAVRVAAGNRCVLFFARPQEYIVFRSHTHPRKRFPAHTAALPPYPLSFVPTVGVEALFRRLETTVQTSVLEAADIIMRSRASSRRTPTATTIRCTALRQSNSACDGAWVGLGGK
jgi:hypothetical protein